MIRTSLRSACFAAALVAPLCAQSTIRLTAGLGGAEPDGPSSQPSLGGDGRYAVFVSAANNLTANDTSSSPDVFLYDAVQGTVELVSVRLPGPSGSNVVSTPVVTDDGSLVAYASNAANLVPADGGGFTHIYVRDRTAGTTTRITQGWIGTSAGPSMTPDGRYIAFQSSATTVPSGPFQDVFRFDRQNQTFVLISQSSNGTFSDGNSSAPRISADGGLVTFLSSATTLLQQDGNGQVDVYIRDVVNQRTRRTSVGWIGNQLPLASSSATMTRDGRKVCFVNAAQTTSPGDSDLSDDVFARTLNNGYVTRVSTPASRKGGNGFANESVIAGGGRYVAFRSDATDLVPVDPTPGAADVYLKDLETNAVEVVSLSSTDAPAGDPTQPALSVDARFVAFASASGLVAGDSNGWNEIYLRDRGAIVYTTPCAGDGTSTPCPCGNPGSPGNGCENYGLTGGVRMSATGNPSVSNDTLRLGLTGFSAFSTSLIFLQGDGLLNGGAGVGFGDGVACVGGNVIRFGRRVATGGVSAYGAGVAGDPSVSTTGLVVAPGTRYYQVLYANFGSFCGQLRRNWSNSIAVTWAP